MGLFDKLVGNSAPGGQAQSSGQTQITPDMMRREIGNIQANPSAYLGQRGFKIPAGMTDPREITVHLLRSGQVGGNRVQQIVRSLGLLK